MAIEPESITEVDESIRDAWIAEAANETRERLETGDAPFGEEGTVADGEEVSATKRRFRLSPRETPPERF
ncbi:MAG: hypothetical protein ABEJ73_01480 [Haloplanus sp.]